MHAKNRNTDLSDLARQLHLSSPFLLCGHGIGANYAFSFACNHSDICKGVLLVDPRMTNDIW